MKVIRYLKNKLRWKVTMGDEANTDDTPQKQRVNAMAEAQPGRVVVGWAVNSPELQIEEEAYLDEL